MRGISWAKLKIEIIDGNDKVVARADLERRGEYSPMTLIELEGPRMRRREVWPTADMYGLPVLLAGGEVGILQEWHHDEDHSWWKWAVEFSNHTGRPDDWAPPGQRVRSGLAELAFQLGQERRREVSEDLPPGLSAASARAVDEGHDLGEVWKVPGYTQNSPEPRSSRYGPTPVHSCTTAGHGGLSEVRRAESGAAVGQAAEAGQEGSRVTGVEEERDDAERGDRAAGGQDG